MHKWATEAYFVNLKINIYRRFFFNKIDKLGEDCDSCSSFK